MSTVADAMYKARDQALVDNVSINNDQSDLDNMQIFTLLIKKTFEGAQAGV
jgi:hypothetical protein